MNADDLRGPALQVLSDNRRSGVGLAGQPVSFSWPSPATYPFQWFWDSCFHAIALAHLHPEWAIEELEALAASQQPDGFIPHVTFHGGARMSYWAFVQGRGFRPRRSAMIQPPVFGYAVCRVGELLDDDALVERLLPAVDAYHDWLFRERDHDGDGLISIITPYESGMDHKPAYDAALGSRSGQARTLTPRLRRLDIDNKRRGFSLAENVRRGRFHAEDVIVNTFLGLSLEAAAEAHQRLGQAEAATKARDRAERLLGALLKKSWDPEAGLFWELYGAEEQALKTATISGLTPLALGLPREVVERLVDTLTNPGRFWPAYPCPSVALDEPAFDAGSPYSVRSPLIWRGGTWVNTNWLLHLGLRRHGYHDIADELCRRTQDLIRQSGFREFFNPFTGKGYGASSFGWSTLVVDMAANSR
ncbi:MAG: hypothetical protein WEB00_12695 [Dehalococcoidia bacterium]